MRSPSWRLARHQHVDVVLRVEQVSVVVLVDEDDQDVRAPSGDRSGSIGGYLVAGSLAS